MDRIMQSHASFDTLIDVVERQAAAVRNTSWWGPVIGSDEGQSDSLLGGESRLENNVLEDEKAGSRAVCED